MEFVIWGLYFVLMCAIAYRLLRSCIGKPVTVRAEVVHKQTVEFYSRTAPGGKRVKYSVTFLANGKKKSFYVSEFSYGGYRKGEKGTLTYKGDRLIDFQ